MAAHSMSPCCSICFRSFSLLTYLLVKSKKPTIQFAVWCGKAKQKSNTEAPVAFSHWRKDVIRIFLFSICTLASRLMCNSANITPPKKQTKKSIGTPFTQPAFNFRYYFSLVLCKGVFLAHGPLHAFSILLCKYIRGLHNSYLGLVLTPHHCGYFWLGEKNPSISYNFGVEINK